MYMRLAFSVAAHLISEILLVDEVLAVGDLAFQKKCLGKMHDATRQGRTVLFISHDMTAIKSLCSRGVLLDAGRVAFDGSVDEAVDAYRALLGGRHSETGIIPDDLPRQGCTSEARFRSVQLMDKSGNPITQLYFGQPFRVNLTVDVKKEIAEGVIELGIATL